MQEEKRQREREWREKERGSKSSNRQEEKREKRELQRRGYSADYADRKPMDRGKRTDEECIWLFYQGDVRDVCLSALPFREIVREGEW